MIKPNELRIGNLVYHYEWNKLGKKLTPDSGRVTAINGKSVTVGPYQRAKIEGIPLTQEILEKCGFKKFERQRGIVQWENEAGHTVEYTNGEWSLSPEFNFWIDVKYLHQLQNLYFALTGQELEVNLD